MPFETLSGLVKYTIDNTNNWQVTNPILPTNVLCFESVGTNYKLKIGDGINRWNTTPYFIDQPLPFADLDILGSVTKATLSETIDGIDSQKYITASQLLTRLSSLVSGDLIILAPGSLKYRYIDNEVYIDNNDYPALRAYGTPEPENGGYVPDIAFRMEHKGSATISFQMRKGLGNTYIRVAKNLEVLQEWSSTSSSYRTFTTNVSFVPGDIIQIQAKDTWVYYTGRIRQVRLLTNTIP